jgi:thiol-disulfide isomerase/thioredoxin
MPVVLTDSPLPAQWTVVCLCAAWCDSCRAYQPLFTQWAQNQTDTQAVWLDVEDDSAWLGAFEVETFPTLLIAHHDAPLFCGPVRPTVAALAATVAAAQRALKPLAGVDADVQHLLQRLRGQG